MSAVYKLSGSFQELVLVFLDCFGDPQSLTARVFPPPGTSCCSQPGRQAGSGLGHSEQVTFQGDGWMGNGWVDGQITERSRIMSGVLIHPG